MPHKREELKFELYNESTVGLYYSWSTDDKQKRAKIQYNRKEGYLKSPEKLIFTASFQALRKCILKNITLKLKVQNSIIVFLGEILHFFFRFYMVLHIFLK